MSSTKKNSYQSLSLELDQILSELQNPLTDVDTALALHERGQAVVKQMQTYLKSAQNKISVVPAKPKAK